jgi:signal transduction histidine kinase
MGGVKSEAAHMVPEPVARPPLYNPWVTFVGQIGYVCAVFLIFLFFRSAVPEQSMRWWLWVAVPVCISAIAFSVSLMSIRPPWEQFLKWWRPVDMAFTHLFDLVAVAAIFLLFPHGDESQRLVFLAFCVGYGPLQMISDPENARGTQLSVVTILGSFALALFLNDDPAKWILSALFFIYGTILIFASADLRNTAMEAVRRRRQSDKDAKALAAALSEVSASRDAVTRFIASASHDLGQPLQAASLFARQLDRDLSKSKAGDSDGAKALSSLQTAIASAQDLTGHMFSFLRLEADAVTPIPVIVNAGKIFETVISQQQAVAEEHGVKLDFVSTSMEIMTDPSLLQRALGNLVNNAIIHSGGRRVLAGVKSAGPHHVRFWVIDNGTGISAYDKDRIFEDYVQAQSQSGFGKTGFGLGLASVRRIATLLGGQAALAASTGRGAAFYIELPR